MKAAFRVTGLAQGASAVNGNYKQAKCVTCPNAVAESLRGHRAQARWLAGWLLFIHCAAPWKSTDSFYSFSVGTLWPVS